MQILLAPFGTRGDIQPCLALAHGLRAAGHQPSFCAPPDYQGWIEREGFPYTAVGRPFQFLIGELTAGMSRALRLMAEEVPFQFQAMAPLMERADLVLGASMNYACASLAEKMGVPYRAIFFSPASLPSDYHPVPMGPLQGLPRWVNRLSWRSWEWATSKTVGKPLNRERSRLGLPLAPETFSHMIGAVPVLAADPVLAPAPPDLAERAETLGAWLMPEQGGLPPALEDFLRAGPPPIYLGFGSMPDKKPAETTRLLLEAIQQAGVRALLSSGWAGLGQEDLPATVRLLPPTPHRALFPRCAAVVHHGGAGTMTTAALAGTPQLVVPHEVDQFFHARRVAELGLGPASIPRRRLQAGSLAAALRALAEGRYQEQAQALAPRVGKDGVARAVAALVRRPVSVREERAYMKRAAGA